MRTILVILTALATCAAIAHARDPTGTTPQEEVPAACRPNAQDLIDYERCAREARPGSNAHRLALINLGTAAFARSDYAAAVRYYDEAQPPGRGRVYSDASFHAFRAAAYSHVGRAREALDQARTALAILQDSPSVPADIRALPLPAVFDEALVYSLILPILRDGGDAGFEGALAAYRAIPASEWFHHANRAAVLEQLGEPAAALEANARALALQPEEPGVLNNHCYILTRLGRPHEGLPYCERALRVTPREAAIRHSYAAGLAASGQCDRAEQELAEARRLNPLSTTYREPIACTPRELKR